MNHFCVSRWLARLFIGAWLLPCFCAGAMNWDAQRIELTAKLADKQAVGVFRFVNAGNTTITITSVKSDCGCTTADLSKQTYAPGEAGEIKAVFTFEGRVGQQDKTIQVTTDDEPTKPVTLMLRVNILEPLTCAPRLLLWRIGDDESEKEAVIASKGANWIVTLDFKATPAAAVVARLETLDAGKKYRLLVQPASTASAAQTSLACVATFADGTTLSFTVFALVR